jgi:putative FmdB family regulatory protein
MPIYEYRCDQGHTFEVMRRMSDEPLSVCQTCEAPVEQVFHPIAIHFKGSGFYNTDYGTKKRSREQQEKNSEKAKSEAKTEGKAAEGKATESKAPDAKATTSSSTESKTEKKASTPKKSGD